MTTWPPRRRPLPGPGPAGRWACAAAVTLLTVPAMLLAHLIITHRVPSAAAVSLVGLVVLVLAAAGPARSRAGLAAVVALGQAAGQTLLAVLHAGPPNAPDAGCLPAVGRGAELGLQLTLFRHDAACPPGTLAPGPGATAALAAVLTAALLLVGHTLVAMLAATLVAGAAAALTALGALARLVLVRVRPQAPVTTAPRAVLPTTSRHRPLPAVWIPGPLTRRGPPEPVPA